MLEIRRWSVFLLISFCLVITLPHPVSAPPITSTFRLGPPIALDQNLTLHTADVDIEVNTVLQDEDYYYYTNMEGVYYIQSTSTGNYSIAFPLPSQYPGQVISSQTEIFMNGQQIQYQVYNSSDLEFNTYLDPNDFDWFLDREVPTAVFNSTILSDSESILGISLSCHLEGWGNFFGFSYWVDTDDFWIPYSIQSVRLIVNNFEYLDQFEFIPLENLTTTISGDAQVGRWFLDSNDFGENEVGFRCQQYEYNLPTYGNPIEQYGFLVPVIILVSIVVIAYAYLRKGEP